MHQDGMACSNTTVFSFPDQLWPVIADLGMRYGNVATPSIGSTMCTFISLCCGLNFHSIPALVSALNLDRHAGKLQSQMRFYCATRLTTHRYKCCHSSRHTLNYVKLGRHTDGHRHIHTLKG